MNLLMISGDRNLAAGKPGAFDQTIAGLAEAFERIDIVCPFVKDASVRQPLSNVFVHPSPHGLLRQIGWIVSEGKRLIAAHRHGVITVQDYPPFYNGIGAWLLARSTRTPYVLEVHHIVGWPHAASVQEWIGRMLSRFYLPFASRKAAAVRVVNRTVATLLATWGVPADKLRLVSSFYLHEAALTPASAPATVDMAFCARLVPNKGLLQFIRAVGLVSSATAVVIGDGPLKNEAQELCRRMGMEHRVRFTGWLPAGGQLDAMRSAKMLVMCSLSEGGPRVVLEAMACGIPVVATPVGIVQEIITGENGLLTTGTPADIAAKVQSLLGDGARREQMGRAARAAVLPRFSSSVTLPAYAAFLQSVV